MIDFVIGDNASPPFCALVDGEGAVLVRLPCTVNNINLVEGLSIVLNALNANAEEEH